MAAIEVKVCDRCGKVLEDYNEKIHNVGDWITARSYDLCEDCKEEFDIYKAKGKKIDEEMEELVKAYGFGKYSLRYQELKERMLEEDKKEPCKNWFKRMFIRKG